MIRLAVNNRPLRETADLSLLVAELGSVESIKLDCSYIVERFERRHPEHTVTSVAYSGLSACKRYARFKVEYLENDNIR